MAIFKEFHLENYKKIIIPNDKYELAIKNAKTHDMEIILEYGLYFKSKCNKCKIECDNYPTIKCLLYMGEVLYLTCEEVIIKGIIE